MIFAVAFCLFVVYYGFMNYNKTGKVYPVFYVSNEHKRFLEKYFIFYRKLPAKSKAIFLKRISIFISSKRFIPRNLKEVSSEMKILIAASAIQLTFGFPRLVFSHFSNILVYPDNYYSTINNTYHKGEVNPRMRAIVLSWKAFVEGYLQPDGRNLGLHEMAHALRLENQIMNREYNFLDSQILHKWERFAERTMKEIRNGTETFFREYGAHDKEEFFAVAVENFFERPREFSKQHLATYQTLSKLLRQDPLLLENSHLS